MRWIIYAGGCLANINPGTNVVGIKKGESDRLNSFPAIIENGLEILLISK